GRKCPSYSDCHYYKARQRLQNADILVVNHALFFTDLAQLKKDSIHPDFKYGNSTKMEIEDQIRSMLVRLEKLEGKIG
ncbi:MAG: hypothetical protein AAGG68_25915, partial [Bacteroidota bacterium]